MCERKLQRRLSLLYRITILQSGNTIVLDIMVDVVSYGNATAVTQANNGNHPFNGPIAGRH
jgi:hypothetical protein